jgi:putative redox protein
MKTSVVQYKGGLRTEAQHLKSGQKVITDAPTDNHGKGEAFSPTDLLATSLGSCMISLMGIIAMQHNFIFEGGSVEITKVMASDPRRVSEIIAEVHMPKIPFTDQQKRLLEHAALNCPVAKSLHPDIKQVITFDY